MRKFEKSFLVGVSKLIHKDSKFPHIKWVNSVLPPEFKTIANMLYAKNERK